MTQQTRLMKHLRPHVSVEVCLLYQNHYQTMPSKENLDPVDLRLKELRARRDYLKAKLQRIRDLKATKKLLQEQIAFLRQRLREREENVGSDSNEDQETRKKQ